MYHIISYLCSYQTNSKMLQQNQAQRATPLFIDRYAFGTWVHGYMLYIPTTSVAVYTLN